jgi:serine protease SohB
LNNEQEENIIDFEASSNATAVEDTVKMEVIILLESPGGSASDYGLAAQQIARLRDEPGIDVTICIDKVAASGGYVNLIVS